MFKILKSSRLKLATLFAFALLVSMLFASYSQSNIVQAQDTPYNNIPSVSSETFTLDETLLQNLMQQLPRMGLQSDPIGGTFQSGFTVITVNSIEQFGVMCENLIVIFVDPLTSTPVIVDVRCNGSQASIQRTGPGAYFFFNRDTTVLPFLFTSPRQIVTDMDL